MPIDWPHFTPLTALAGGLLIGAAASALMLLNGRIAGISGIVAGLLSWSRLRSDGLWRAAFVTGLLAAPFAYSQVRPLPLPAIDTGFGPLALAGLLVGIGTRLGSGCTSGHGVCGLSRLSMRSLVATLCFMGVGFLAVALLRPLLLQGATP